MRTRLGIALLFATGLVQAQNCVIELTGDDAMRFDKDTVTVSSSCASIEIKLTHTGKLPVNVMGHNVVISPTADYQAAAQDGMKAGFDGNYVQAGDARVIGHTKLIGGGQSTSTTIPGSALKAGGDYTFYCSYPGHWAIMKGKIVVE